MSLYETVGTRKYSYLLASPEGAEKIAVSLKPGTGTLKLGTVLYKDADGFYSAAAAANVVASNDLVVLDEDVDIAGAAVTGGTVAPSAAAFRQGRLVRGAVKLASDAALSAANEIVLRQQGIYLVTKDGAAEFNNVVSDS